MKGLSIEQYSEILDLIQRRHSFMNFDPKSRHIKYINASYDTRFGDFWRIEIPNSKLIFASNHFAGKELPDDWKYNNLYDLIMDYLDFKFEPTEDFYQKS